MDAIDRATARPSAAEIQARRRLDAAALWSALRADLRSRDERTARLRTMLLVAGAERDA